MKHVVWVSIAVAISVPVFAAASDPAEKRTLVLEHGENDRAFAGTEDGCLDGRILDYRRRHGVRGRIDSDLLLERTREYQRAMSRERVAADGIGGSAWTSLGPTDGGGRMVAISHHPTTPGTTLVGAAGGGVWKTTNGGVSWTPLTDSIPNLSVGAVAYAPSSPSTIYVGTGEGGIGGGFTPGIGLLKSTDGGANWILPDTVIATQFYKLSIAPANPNDILAATNEGLLRSTNGQNGPWTTVIRGASAGVIKGYGDVADLVRDPSNAQILYATTFDREYHCMGMCSDPTNFQPPTVLKSSDGGQNWTPLNGSCSPSPCFPPGIGLPVPTATRKVSRLSIAIAPSSPSTLYVATSIFEYDTGVGRAHIYKTQNAGFSWTETAMYGSPYDYYFLWQPWYNNTIVVAPNDPNLVLAGGVICVRTTDGGSTWAPANVNMHVDAHDMRYDATGTLWVANDGGIWTSTDHLATDANTPSRNAGLVTRQFYFIANDPVNRNRIFGGQQDNGSIRRPDAGGTVWDYVSGGDGMECVVIASAPSIALTTVNGKFIHRTEDAGASPVRVREVTPRYTSEDIQLFDVALVADPVTPSTVYTATHRVWKSRDAGNTWVPLPATVQYDGGATGTLPGGSIQVLAVAPSNPQVVMFANSSEVYRSNDGGQTWRYVNTTGFGSSHYCNDIAFDPTNADVIYIAQGTMTGAPVRYTTDGGLTWADRASGLPPFAAQVVLVDPTDSNTVYCGTDVGVYRSTDQGASWSRFGTGLPAVAVYDLEALDDGSILRAGTYGRGVWELNVTGNTNTPPAAAIAAPASPVTVSKGQRVTFEGYFVDDDPGDMVTGKWTFGDVWRTKAATSGSPAAATFHRGGTYPVTLSARDSHGALALANVDVIVRESGDACSAPIVIPGSGPFPYTVTADLSGADLQVSDPEVSAGECYFEPQRVVWIAFTPAVTDTYQFSLCGSNASAEIAGFTGAACGPYTHITDFCTGMDNVAQYRNCATTYVRAVSLTAGTTIRIAVSNLFQDDFGPVSLTVTRSSSLTPAFQSVSPAAGSTAGGTAVVLTGSGFVAGATVAIGGVPAASVSVLTESLITAVTGPHAAGEVAVTVTNPGATTATLGGGFTYFAAVPAGPPSALTAVATSAASVAVQWAAVTGADHYEIYRNNGSGYVLAGSTGAESFADTGRAAYTSFLYRTRAIGFGGEASSFSNIDLATTAVYADDPLMAGATPIKAVHVIQLRSAVDAVRALASLAPAAFTDPSLAGTRIKAVHVTELRSALNAARAAAGLPAAIYTHTVTAGSTLVRSLDLMEIRAGTR